MKNTNTFFKDIQNKISKKHQKKEKKNFLSNDQSSPLIKSFVADHIETKKTFETKITPLTKGYKTLIKIDNLTKSFNKGKIKVEVLKGISFEIRENENVALVGSNGAGKTTAVEIIAGINKPTSGTVNYYFGNDRKLENMGIQFQDSSYPSGLNTKEIIDFIIGIYGAEISEEDFKGLLSIFGIDKFLKRRASALSGGQLQRLNALLAILHKPKVIFLDEISTGLDIAIRTKIKDFLKTYTKENGMTICLVSHSNDEITHLADRLIIIVDGKIAAAVYIDDIIAEYGSINPFIDKYI